MKKAEEAYITIGKIGATYGVFGWLKIQSFTEFGASILSYQPWYLSSPPSSTQHRQLEIEDAKPYKNSVIVKFKGIDSPEAARLLTGQQIEIKREQLPTLAKNEYYWSDLEGLTVINKDGTVLGKVIYLIATGSNDVLVVKGKKEIGIPFLLGSVILQVDLEQQQIHVDWEDIG